MTTVMCLFTALRADSQRRDAGTNVLERGTTSVERRHEACR